MNSSKRLLEWLDSNGNKVSLNGTARTQQVQQPQQTNDRFKERFMKLAKHIEDIHDWSLISYVTEWELELEYTSATGATHTLSIDVNSKNIKVELSLSLFGKKYAALEAGHNEWNRVLDFLKDMKVIQDTKLCEDLVATNTVRSSANESSLTETLIFNKNDLEFNLDKFESGESNVLLVTGFSGSGKTTTAEELATSYGCNHFQIDWLTDYLFGNSTKEDLAEVGEAGLLAYIEHTGLNNTYTYDDFKEPELINLIRDYIKFLIAWCKSQGGQKFIIEGLQIYNEYEEGDTHITSCPMIIKGTSGLVSTLRAARRNEGSALSNFGPLIKFIFRDNKKINKLEKDMMSTCRFAEEFKLYEKLWN